jgi:hypothetical protein
VYLLDVEPLDLGPGVHAVGLDLTEADENREPVRGHDAGMIWSRVLTSIAGKESWTFDFFSHLDRVRDFCKSHQIKYRDASQCSLVIPAPETASLESLVDRFQSETFGARAGGLIPTGDPAIEGELASRGVDAYHAAYRNYFYCAVCSFNDGSLVLLSEKLWTSEVIRRLRPALDGLSVEVRLPSLPS